MISWFGYIHRHHTQVFTENLAQWRMDGLAVEEKGIGAVAGRLVHVDQALDEGVHVVGGDAVLGHDLGGQGVVLNLLALLENVGAGMTDRRGAAPDKLGAGGLEAGDEDVEVFLVLLGSGGADAPACRGITRKAFTPGRR